MKIKYDFLGVPLSRSASFGSGVPHFANAHSSAPCGRSRTASQVLHALTQKKSSCKKEDLKYQ